MSKTHSLTVLSGKVEVNHDFILDQCYAEPGDVVIVAGTLVEGIGNIYSDIDVYVITNKYRSSRSIDLSRHHRVISTERDIIRADTPECDVLLTHTVVPGTSIKVDVEFKTFTDIEKLFDRVRSIFEYAASNLILLTKRLTDREEALIHRLMNCIPILGASEYEKLLQGFSRSQYCYVAYRWFASDFSVLLDLFGAWENGEIDRAVEIARDNVITQTAGYLHLTGVTNLRRKWLLTYLSRISGQSNIHSKFLDLTYMRGTDDLEGKVRYVERSLDFVDEIFRCSRSFLEAIPDVPVGERAIELLRSDNGAEDGEYANWEFEYRARAYGFPSPATRHRLRKGNWHSGEAFKTASFGSSGS